MGDQQAQLIGRKKRPERFQKNIKRFLGMLGSAAVLSTAFLGTEAALTSNTAAADAGDPFDQTEPAVLIVQGHPNAQLQRAVASGDGSMSFEAVGDPAPIPYNAVGFNTADGYLYGIVSNPGSEEFPMGSLIRVGQTGGLERVGDTIFEHDNNDGENRFRFFAGAFNPADGYLYVADTAPNTTMLAINVNDGTLVRSINLGEPLRTPDFAFLDGYAWGGMRDGQLRRINVETGESTIFENVLPAVDEGYGGNWVFGNGNLGFSDNTSGNVVQLQVENGASDNPTFTVVSTVSGPSSSANDGTAIPGLPADLSIEKTAPETFVNGDQISYDIVVTNNGDGVSSGWTATDILPEGLIDPEFNGDGTPDINPETGVVTVSGGRLEPGQTAEFTVTAGTDVAMGECITNDASVLGNEEDPNPDNNQSSVTSCENAPELSIEKSSDFTEDMRPGDTVEYTISATNTGTGEFTEDNPAVVMDDLSGLLDDSEFNDDAVASIDGELGYAEPLLSWAGPLASGETVELAYSVTLQGGGDGEVRNVAWQPTDPEDPTPPVCDPPGEDGTDPDTGEACATVENLLPKLSIEKSADRTDLPAIGEDATYTVTVTNEGPGDYTDDAPATMSDDLSEVLDDATFLEGSLEASVGEVDFEDGTLVWSGPLAAGDSATISYTVTYTGEGDQQLDNMACVPEDEVVADGEACATVSIPGSDLDTWKSVEAADDPVVAGSELTYTLHFENSGTTAATVNSVDVLTHVLDDAEVTAEPTADDGLEAVRDGETLTITGTVPAGETLTVSYAVTVLPDGERGDDEVANFLMDNTPEGETPPTPPEDPVCDPADEDRPDCTFTPIAMPQIDEWKTVDPASNTPVVAGQELTYTLHFENSGTATGTVDMIDDLTHVLDDAAVISEPVASNNDWAVERDGERIALTGDIAAGETETIEYTVQVMEEDERGDDVLANFLLEPDAETPTDPVCEPSDEERPDCTINSVGNIVPTKSVDPDTGTEVEAGQELTYTLSFENTGAGAAEIDYVDHMADVLDDAELVGDIEATNGVSVAGPSENQLLISGTVEPGETATVTYTVAVYEYEDRGNHHLGNFLTLADQEPPTECTDENPLCTFNPTPTDPPQSGEPADPVGGDDLASTGTAGFWGLVGLGIALLGAGVAIIIARNRRFNN